MWNQLQTIVSWDVSYKGLHNNKNIGDEKNNKNNITSLERLHKQIFNIKDIKKRRERKNPRWLSPLKC